MEKISINSIKLKVTKLKNIENFQKKYITANTLASSLDLPTTNLYNKLCTLKIYPKFGPSIDRTPLNIYLIEDVKHITRELINSIYYRKINKSLESFILKEKCKEIEKLSMILNIDKFGVKKLIDSGILELEHTSPSWHFRLKKESLTNLLSIINNENYISISDAIKITSSSPNWFYRYWVETGFISIIDLCLWKFIKKDQVEDVLKIKREFFTGKEASDFLGMPHSHITNLVTQNLIAPHEFGSKNIVKLFKKTDVYQLKEKGYGY